MTSDSKIWASGGGKQVVAMEVAAETEVAVAGNSSWWRQGRTTKEAAVGRGEWSYLVGGVCALATIADNIVLFFAQERNRGGQNVFLMHA